MVVMLKKPKNFQVRLTYVKHGDSYHQRTM